MSQLNNNNREPGSFTVESTLDNPHQLELRLRLTPAQLLGCTFPENGANCVCDAVRGHLNAWNASVVLTLVKNHTTTARDSTGDLVCALCAHPVKQADNIHVLDGCGHLFHTACFLQMLDHPEHDACPLCREAITFDTSPLFMRTDGTVPVAERVDAPTDAPPKSANQ